MFPWTGFLLATTAVIIIIICYIVLLVKLKPSDESTENFFPKFQQENDEIPLGQRRMEMLEKIKEERIREYLDKKKRKHEVSWIQKNGALKKVSIRATI